MINKNWILILVLEVAKFNWGFGNFPIFYGGITVGGGIGSVFGPEAIPPGVIIGGSAGAIVGLISWGYDSNNCEEIASAKCGNCSNPN